MAIVEAGKPAGDVSDFGSQLVDPISIGVITFLLSLFTFCLIYFFAALWPHPTTPPTDPSVVTFFWASKEILIWNDARLLVLVAIAGAMGSAAHSLRSLFWYVGHGSLRWRWTFMYLLLPFTGSTLAVIFYLVVRAGFFSPSTNEDQASPFGFTATAGLIGMFSEQAAQKLQEVAETLLSKPKPGSDTVE